MSHEEARKLVDERFVTGALSPLQEHALRAHLRGCDACRMRYDRLAEAEGALVPDAQVERLLAAGPPPPARGTGAGGRIRWWMPALAAAAAAVVFALTQREEPPAYTARGAGAGQGAWIRTFRSDGTPLADPGRPRVRTDEGFLFAWSMERGAPWRHLAIAARDATGRVHWFHPAWRSAAEEPTSLEVEAGLADQELPEVVRAELAPGPLVLCGVFTEKPLQIKEVDAVLEREGRWPEGHVDCHTFEVQR